jgi:hypothetical protein
MIRERALKAVLVVVGLLFTAGVIPLTMFFSREPAVPMIMSIYVTLGIFLLLAVRDPAANRSLIAFGGWANLAHAGVNGCAGIPECDRAPGTRGSGCVRNRRCSAGRAGSRKAVSRESVFCGGVVVCLKVISDASRCRYRHHPRNVVSVPSRSVRHSDSEGRSNLFRLRQTGITGMLTGSDSRR